MGLENDKMWHTYKSNMCRFPMNMVRCMFIISQKMLVQVKRYLQNITQYSTAEYYVTTEYYLTAQYYLTPVYCLAPENFYLTP